MKIAGKQFPLRLIVVLVWGVFAFILTTQSDRVPLVHFMTTTIGSTEFGDAFGHAGLFATLCLLLYVAFSRWLPSYRALVIAMTIALLIGASTEVYQFLVPGRGPSLSDLMANYLGIFVVAFIALSRMKMTSTHHP